MKNKYQEALDFLIINLNDEWFDWAELEEKWEHIENVQELVDRAIPMKPVYRILDISWNKNEKLAHCPTCDWRLDWGQGCHNNKCRQSIDWSEDE